MTSGPRPRSPIWRSDDEDGYRRVCQILRDRHPAVFDERHACENLADRPQSGTRWRWRRRQGPGLDRALGGDHRSGRQGVQASVPAFLGAVLYRLGRYREAIDRIQEGIALGSGEVPPEEAVFLAMAHFRIGDTEKARALLAGPWDDEPDRRSVEEWWDDRPLRLLRREAARLILDRDFPADPFAP